MRNKKRKTENVAAYNINVILEKIINRITLT